jgi:hypothetical protein
MILSEVWSNIHPQLAGSKKFFDKQSQGEVDMKYGKLTLGQIEALVNKIGGEDAVREVLRGALKVVTGTPKWSIGEDGLVRFSLTADGTSGSDWEVRLARGGYPVKSTPLNQIMFEPRHFKPTVETRELVILPGTAVSNGSGRVAVTEMYAEARRRRFKRPNSEIGPLMREMFSYDDIEALGLYSIFIGHKSVVEDGYHCNFYMDDRAGGRWLSVLQGKDPASQIRDDIGYVFEIPGE